MTLLQFQPPADNQRGPAFLEGLLAGWVSLCGKQGMKLGIASDQGRIVFLLDVPADRQRVIAAQIANAYPGGQIAVLAERKPSPAPQPTRRTSAWLRLSPDVYPLKLHPSFVEEHSRDAIDPLEGLLEVI